MTTRDPLIRRAVPPRRVWPTLAGVLMLASGGHAQTAPGRAGSGPDETIGTAVQEEDGTIVLQLRTPSGSGMTGDALVRYPPGNADHMAVSRHVGPIPQGGSVFVRPFGDR